MLTANWDRHFDKLGDVRFTYIDARTCSHERCIEEGRPGKWTSRVIARLDDEPVVPPKDHKNGQWGFGRFG